MVENTCDHVVVINCKYLHITGNKAKYKKYYYHTGYPGGLKKPTAEMLMEENPSALIYRFRLASVEAVSFASRGWTFVQLYTNGEIKDKSHNTETRKCRT
jgi:hypothetical protein